MVQAGLRKVSLAMWPCVGEGCGVRPELRPGRWERNRVEAGWRGRAGSTPTKGAFYETDTRAEQNPQTLHLQGLTQTLAKGQRPRRGWALFPASLVPLQSPRAATRKPRTRSRGRGAGPKGDTLLPSHWGPAALSQMWRGRCAKSIWKKGIIHFAQ